MKKHGIVLAVVGVVVFLGVGTMVLASSTNCGLGPAKDDPEANETPKRSDDYTWFSHFVCTAEKSQSKNR